MSCRCTFCGSLLSGGEVRLGHRLACCQGCGSILCLDEVSEEVLASLYSDPRYYSGGLGPYGYNGDFATHDAVKRPLWEERLDAIAALAQGRRLLEIGPGRGGFARLAAASGWDVLAVDLFPGGPLPVPVVPSIEDAARTGAFDVVCLFDVIEHLADPLVILSQLPSLLAPGGCVAIAAPNAGGGSFRSLGFDWSELKPPEHLSVPSHRGMEAVLKRAGLELVGTVGHFAQTWHAPWVMKRLLEAPQGKQPAARARHFGLRVVNLITHRVRIRLPHPPPERQDYVTWMARPLGAA